MKYVMLLTGREIVNKKILHLALVLTTVFLLFYGIALHFTMKEVSIYNLEPWREQIAYQFMGLGWYIAALLTGALAILMGSGSISREIESGTILNLASRPLSRRAILGGKFLAYALMAILYSSLLLSSISLLLIYFVQIELPLLPLSQGIAIFALQPLILLAVTQLVSVLWGTMAGGVAGFALFILSIVGGFIEQIGSLISNGNLINTGIATSLLMPTDTVYRLALSQASGTMGSRLLTDFGPFGVASLPSPGMMAYTLIYLALILYIAFYNFQRQDL